MYKIGELVKQSKMEKSPFGSLLALGTAASFLTGISVLEGSTMAALSLLIKTTFLVTLAHDMLQIGLNLNSQNFRNLAQHDPHIVNEAAVSNLKSCIYANTWLAWQ